MNSVETLKCLILAYDFPPYTSMGGQRPFGWYSYLKEFNIEPTIVTRQWPKEIKSKLDYSRSVGRTTVITKSEKGVIHAVPYKSNIRDKILLKYGFKRFGFIRRGLTLLQNIFQYVSPFFDNKSAIYKEANQLLKAENFDIIIATSEPFVLFRYAYLLGGKFNTKWIADYRDCWSDNFEINRQGGFNKVLHKTFFKFLEKRYVSKAAAIITAAPFFAKQLSSLFTSKRIDVIYNGFIKDMFSLSRNQQNSNSCFTIAFAGTIYPFQPIELFLKGLEMFIKEVPDAKIQVKFYGTNYNLKQKDRVVSYSQVLKKYIETTDRLSQVALFSELQNSDMLLLLDNKGMISGKLYEYLALRRPILMAGSDNGSMEKIINETNAGYIANTSAEMASIIENHYNEWQQIGQITCNSRNIEQYSRKEQTKKLAEVLSDL